MVIAGFGLGMAIMALGQLSGMLRDVPWPLWTAIPLTILIAIGLADRDGWNIRRAMAYVALQQRARWTPGPIPQTTSMAQAWLDDPANAGADALLKVSMLMTIGNLTAARAMLDDYAPATDLQAAAATRFRAYMLARETGTMEMERIRAVSERLGEDDRRYQLTSAALMQLWLDIEARRPWRKRFADAVREFGPYQVPGRVLAFISFQQLLAPCVLVVVITIGALVVGW